MIKRSWISFHFNTIVFGRGMLCAICLNNYLEQFNVNTNYQEQANHTTEGFYSEVIKLNIALEDNKKYYLAINQNNVFVSYYICLLRRNLNGFPIVTPNFQLTVAAVHELLSCPPAALHAANKLNELCCAEAIDESCWAKEPKTILLERMTSDIL